MEKLIITAALTGAEVSKEQQPALPVTPDEIGSCRRSLCQAGAVHRSPARTSADGTPTQDKAVYREIIAAVRARCDVIIQVSTGGAVGMTAAERLAPVTLAPEMATLSMGSVNFGDDVFLNHPADMKPFART
jgi:3-keto-5-aminohexanoate cleavage enzyme